MTEERWFIASAYITPIETYGSIRDHVTGLSFDSGDIYDEVGPFLIGTFSGLSDEEAEEIEQLLTQDSVPSGGHNMYRVELRRASAFGARLQAATLAGELENLPSDLKELAKRCEKFGKALEASKTTSPTDPQRPATPSKSGATNQKGTPDSELNNYANRLTALRALKKQYETEGETPDKTIINKAKHWLDRDWKKTPAYGKPKWQLTFSDDECVELVQLKSFFDGKPEFQPPQKSATKSKAKKSSVVRK